MLPKGRIKATAAQRMARTSNAHNATTPLRRRSAKSLESTGATPNQSRQATSITC
jgi:hypothetical protein